MTFLLTRPEFPLIIIALSTTGLLVAVLLRFREIQRLAAENEERVHYMSLAGDSVFWKFDFSTDTIQWGEGFERLYGRERDGRETSTAFWEGSLHSEDKARVVNSLDAAGSSGQTVWSQEYRILTPPSTKYVLDRGIIIRDENGAPVKLLGAISDVTSQVEAREAARASEKRFRDVVENITDVFYNHSPHKGEMYYVNAMYETIWGKTTQSLYEKARSFLDAVHPEDAHVLYTAFERQLAGERTEVEYRIVRPDGQIRWIRDQGVPLPGADGPATQIVGTARDITDSKVATLALIESESRLKEIGAQLQVKHQRMVEAQEVAKLGSWEADLVTGDVEWSPESYRIFDKDPATFTPTLDAIFGMLPEEDREALWAEFERLLGVEGRHLLEHRLFGADNSIKHIELRFRPVLGAEGKPIRVVGTVLDVTSSKQREEKLRESQKMEAVGLLAGGIAHDFNNMLTVIIAQSQMALAGRVSPEKLPSTMHLIHDAANRSADLTRQLLAFAQRRDDAATALNPGEKLESLMPILRSLAGERIRLEVSIPEDVWKVRMGALDMHQIYTNLVLNARDAIRSKANGEGGTIRISMENIPAKTGDRVQILVSDDGVGMDEQVRARIFEPFFTTKQVGAGTGLGLSVLHGIITQAGGSIQVASTPGGGASIFLSLPRCENPAQDPDGGMSAVAKEIATPHVLLVEDEPMVLETTAGMLEQIGCRVTKTPCAVDALSQVTRDPLAFDLLLTDLVMPNMTGYELAERIRKVHPGLRVLVMTGYDPGLAHGEPMAGVIGSPVQKPFTLETLSEAIHQALSNDALRPAG